MGEGASLKVCLSRAEIAVRKANSCGPNNVHDDLLAPGHEADESTIGPHTGPIGIYIYRERERGKEGINYGKIPTPINIGENNVCVCACSCIIYYDYYVLL